MLIFEDIDAQSNIVHRRQPDSSNVEAGAQSNGIQNAQTGGGRKGKGRAEPKGPTLSGLLNCLDGHGFDDGIIVIFATNYPEKLDPAVIRPGRIDLHLQLGNTTHFQLRSMFDAVMAAVRNVRGSQPDDLGDNASVVTDVQRPRELDLTDVPEKVIPPFKAFGIITWLRDRPNEIGRELKKVAKELLGRRLA